MRYAVVILLLASPVISGEPVYSWRSRADDPERVYLDRDGKQVGAWYYLHKQYRPFDGKTWGPPTATAPVRPPERRVVVVPPQKPVVMTPPVFTPIPPLRGPFRVRAATVMGQATTDMTMHMVT